MWPSVKINRPFPLFPVRNGERIDSSLRTFFVFPFLIRALCAKYHPTPEYNAIFMPLPVQPKVPRVEIYAGLYARISQVSRQRIIASFRATAVIAFCAKPVLQSIRA